uniref:Uncharacterized protein n=1 Tax=Timema shepardi TaxID=629360 RepID=A0A7R9B4N2_TIMSH|nr:unnamed protein product [Timema shepardi]
MLITLYLEEGTGNIIQFVAIIATRHQKKRDSQQEQRLPNFTGRTSMRKRTSTHDINSKTTKRCDPSAAFRRYAPPLASGTTWTPRTA